MVLGEMDERHSKSKRQVKGLLGCVKRWGWGSVRVTAEVKHLKQGNGRKTLKLTPPHHFENQT